MVIDLPYSSSFIDYIKQHVKKMVIDLPDSSPFMDAVIYSPKDKRGPGMTSIRDELIQTINRMLS